MKKTYEVTVKVPAYYGREGSGKYWVGKVEASWRGLAISRAVDTFLGLNEAKDLVGRQMEIKIVRVL